MTARRPQSGFILVMVLLVLAVAASLLAACARQTTRLALEAGAAERELQRRWGERAIEAACLPRAEAILGAAATETDPAPAAVRASVVLGGMDFDVMVADEAAKANVNLLAEKREPDALPAALSDLGAGRWSLQVIPRPIEPSGREIRSPRMRFVHLEQVYVTREPAALLGTADRPGPASLVTCWGDGRVHFRRAPRDVLRTVLEGSLSAYAVDRLVRLREEDREASLEQLLKDLDLEDDARAAAFARLTSKSSCHSLWIVGRGRTRSWHRFIVEQAGDAGNDSGRWTFAW